MTWILVPVSPGDIDASRVQVTSRELMPTSGNATDIRSTIGASRVATVLPHVPTTRRPATASWAERVAVTARASTLSGSSACSAITRPASVRTRWRPDRWTSATPSADSSEVRCWETAPGV